MTERLLLWDPASNIISTSGNQSAQFIIGSLFYHSLTQHLYNFLSNDAVNIVTI
jgi:hypothetical protein